MSLEKTLKLVPEPEKPAPHLSILAHTFEAEIKRVVDESGSDVAGVMRRLSEVSGISENHLYNYRSGKTDIPGSHIRTFCSIFRSNALAEVVRVDEIEFEVEGELDFAQICNSHVRSMLEGGQDFLDVFADGRVDGHEEIKLARTSAKINRDSYRLFEIARSIRRRQTASNPGPMAA